MTMYWFIVLSSTDCMAAAQVMRTIESYCAKVKTPNPANVLRFGAGGNPAANIYYAAFPQIDFVNAKPAYNLFLNTNAEIPRDVSDLLREEIRSAWFGLGESSFLEGHKPVNTILLVDKSHWQSTLVSHLPGVGLVEPSLTMADDSAIVVRIGQMPDGSSAMKLAAHLR